MNPRVVRPGRSRRPGGGRGEGGLRGGSSCVTPAGRNCCGDGECHRKSRDTAVVGRRQRGGFPPRGGSRPFRRQGRHVPGGHGRHLKNRPCRTPTAPPCCHAAQSEPVATRGGARGENWRDLRGGWWDSGGGVEQGSAASARVDRVARLGNPATTFCLAARCRTAAPQTPRSSSETASPAWAVQAGRPALPRR